MQKQIEQQIKKIQHLACYDSLTNLPNRFFFNELLIQSILEAKRNHTLFGLFFIDIDDFKKVNDMYGHQTGDELLIQVTKRLSMLLRKTDLIGRFDRKASQHSITTSRIGGDEFTVIIKNFNNHDELLTIAKCVADAVSNPLYKIEGVKLKITVSIGVTVYPTDGKNPDTLLKNSDIAMYQAKKNGKNQIVLHDKKLNEAVVKRNTLEMDMHLALQNHEFILYYQPKISVANKSITGCEALIRWLHPKNGLLMPAEFLPIAEESDLIIGIDKYVLENACRQIAQWKKIKTFSKLVTSINISSRFLYLPNVVNYVENTIKKFDIAPHDLEIEISETHLIYSRKQVAKCLRELRHLLGDGIRISIDDFGIGYSSLNYLSEFKVDELKIDQSFIKKVDIQKDSKSIINAIVSLSHSLDHNVVAEGVETWSQYHFLKKSNCDEVQGFLLGKPMPPEKFIKFVNDWKPDNIK